MNSIDNTVMSLPCLIGTILEQKRRIFIDGKILQRPLIRVVGEQHFFDGIAHLMKIVT